MAINYSTLLRLPKPDAGTQTWATYFHRLSDIMDKFSGDVATVTEKTGSKTLTDADGVADNAKALVITCAQVLTGNLTVVVPTRKRLYIVYNNTTGSFTMQVKTSGGTGATVKQGRFQFVWCDGTNVVPISRLSGQATATEIATGIYTATMSGPYVAGSIINSLLATGAVKKANLFGATGGSGVIRYTATTAGNPWLDLLKGTTRQILAMSTGVVPAPIWKTAVFRDVATSTNIAFTNGSVTSFTHGLKSIAAFSDIKQVVIRLLCLSTDAGYSAGDIIQATMMDGSAGADAGCFYILDSLTVVKVLVGSTGIVASNKSTQVKASLAAAKWALVISAYA